MLKINKSFFRFVLILVLICIVAAFCACVFTVVNEAANTWMRASALCSLLALIFATYYMLKGFSKDAARYLKIFALLFALSEFASLLSIGMTVQEGLPVALSGILFAIVLFMSIGLDIGKGRSFGLCAVMLLLSAAQLILSMVHVPGILLGGTAYGTLAMLRNAVKVLLSVLYWVMIYAKYLDKTARGTK